MWIVWILSGLVGFVLAVLLLLFINAHLASFRRNRRLNRMIEPALAAARNADASAREIVARLAADPACRNHLYAALEELGKEDLFPQEYREVERIAESDLVRWLMHPNELCCPPSEIELVDSVPLEKDGLSGRVFLFRYRVDADHWLTDKGWLAGVAGPYWDGEEPSDWGSLTFSEFESFESRTAEEHVAYLRSMVEENGFLVTC